MTASISEPRELTAGRELDALIAERVMGAQVSWWSLRLVDRPPMDVEWRHGCFTSDASLERMELGEVLVADDRGDMPMQQMLVGGEWENIPRYSTDIASAWKVVEKVDNRNSVAREMGVLTFCINRYDDGYTALVFNVGATAETAPLAICLAALKAVEA